MLCLVRLCRCSHSFILQYQSCNSGSRGEGFHTRSSFPIKYNLEQFSRLLNYTHSLPHLTIFTNKPPCCNMFGLNQGPLPILIAARSTTCCPSSINTMTPAKSFKASIIIDAVRLGIEQGDSESSTDKITFLFVMAWRKINRSHNLVARSTGIGRVSDSSVDDDRRFRFFCRSQNSSPEAPVLMPKTIHAKLDESTRLQDNMVLPIRTGAFSLALIGRSCPGSSSRAEKLELRATSRHAQTTTTHTTTSLKTRTSPSQTPKTKTKTNTKPRDSMASRILRPAFRAANNSVRGFQTSAALRQEKPLVAPVRRPVGAFRGG